MTESKTSEHNLNQVFERWAERLQKFHEKTAQDLNGIKSLDELHSLLTNLDPKYDAVCDDEHILHEAETKFLQLLGAREGDDNLENYKAAISCARSFSEISEQLRVRKRAIRDTELREETHSAHGAAAATDKHF